MAEHDEKQYRRRIRSSNRHETAGVVLSLECGHAVLRRPNYQIPQDLTTLCEECTAAAAVAYWSQPNRWVRFTPVRRDDVRPEAVPWIDGEPFEVQFAGTMDDGPYDGELMWSPVRDQPGPRVGWIPGCDLTDMPR
jgi:hypothetical protein